MLNESGKIIEILLVEDNPGDVFIIKRLLRQGSIRHNLHHVEDGETALRFLHQAPPHVAAPRPHLVLLDLNLPKLDGRQVLEEFKTHPELKLIPVIVLTGSSAPKDIEISYRLQANCYITKPSGHQLYVNMVQAIETFWFHWVQLPNLLAS